MAAREWLRPDKNDLTLDLYDFGPSTARNLCDSAAWRLRVSIAKHDWDQTEKLRRRFRYLTR